MSNSEPPFSQALKTVTLSHFGGISCSGLGKGPRILCGTEAWRGGRLQVIDTHVSVHRIPLGRVTVLLSVPCTVVQGVWGPAFLGTPGSPSL